MTPVSRIWLLLLGLSTAILTGVLSFLALARGGVPLLATPFLVPLFAIFAVTLWWAGLHVRRYKERKPTWVTALSAMRIAVAARASAYVSAASAGVLLGVLAASLTRIAAPFMVTNSLSASFGCVAALFWCVLAVVVERWCIADGDDDQEDPGEIVQTSASPA